MPLTHCDTYWGVHDLGGVVLRGLNHSTKCQFVIPIRSMTLLTNSAPGLRFFCMTYAAVSAYAPIVALTVSDQGPGSPRVESQRAI